MSQSPDIAACQMTVWREVFGSQPDAMPPDAVIVCDELTSALQSKRVLLVVDDVWKSADAQCLMVTRSNPNSRMLVTTRIESIVKGVDVHAQIYHVRFLNKEQSLELLCRWAFGCSKVPEGKHQYANLVDEIEEKCRQLLLALCVIGSMAAGYSRMSDWRCLVAELKKTGLHWDEGHDKELLNVLRISYDNLNDAQKSIFFCMVGYPEDCEVRVSDLVEQWIALQDVDMGEWDASDLQDKGYAVFGQLLSRSLILMDEEQSESLSETSTCHMHDIVRDMGLRIAQENNKDTAERKRLFFPKLQKLQGQSIVARELSTCGDSADSWPPGLQALDLVSFISRDSGLSMLPQNLLRSTNLRLLDMSGSPLREFPCGIEHISTLEVLRLDRCEEIVVLPPELIKLQRLLVLSLRGCRNLQKLPDGLGGLSKLFALYVTDCSAIESILASIHELQDLQKLDL